MTNWLEDNKVKIDELVAQGKSSREIARALGIRPHASGITVDARYKALLTYVTPTPEQWLEPHKEQITELWEKGLSKSHIVDEIRLVVVDRPLADPRYIILGEFLNQLKKQGKKPKKPTLRELFNQAKPQNHV